MTLAQLCSALLFMMLPVSAHIALWDPAMYGWNDNPNQSDPVTPLMDLPFDQWWFHGYIDIPPTNNSIMELPAGGTYHGQVACNKALTSYGLIPAQQTSIYACDGIGPSGGIGAMHTSDAWESTDTKDVKGCAIGIAYESNVTKIQPEDFTVISVNYSCPWKKHVEFQIPSNLPPCPDGGCHCMWGWVHAADAGSEQNYFLGYRCNITGATGVTPLPRANTANKCDYPIDTSNCTVGAKQPHYWFQKERNNNFQGTYDPPFYNGAYGFMNGAQTDLFDALNKGNLVNTNATMSSGNASASEVSGSSAVLSSTIVTVPGASSSLIVSSSIVSSVPSSPNIAITTTQTTESISSATMLPADAVTPLHTSPSSSDSEISPSASTSSAWDDIADSATTLKTTLTRTVTMYRSSTALTASVSSSSDASPTSDASFMASVSVASSDSSSMATSDSITIAVLYTSVVSALASSSSSTSTAATTSPVTTGITPIAADANLSTTSSTCKRKRSGVRKHRIKRGRRRGRFLGRAVDGARGASSPR
ncbi:hypothetical protein CNBG_0390 [Cryptococcus deuterogattii R265]|uniref:uncharacterized protein n=1 Tax=Cryptococcus deuterogattii (strain R265) TaxID=294750 RepID=UPI0019360724|nr:hypothetical protein CNBG_0390 [Cryptococcus deuterogattii R265]